MKKFLSTLCFGALLSASLFGLPMQAEAAEVKVGVLCPLTGKWASEGQDMKNIVNLLAKEYNAKAKKDGKNTISLIFEDDAGDPRSAALAANKLASSEVVAVIGTYGSAVTEASQNILGEANIVQIGTGSTSVRLTEKGLKTFFRTSPRDDSQGLSAANLIKNKGYKRVALLHDNSSYSKGLAEETKAVLDKNKIEIVYFDAITPGERDYTATLTSLKKSNPDIIFFTGYYPETGSLLRQKADMGFKVPMMGGDAANHQDLVKIAGNKAAEGYFFISPPLPQDLDSKEAKDFLVAFQKEYKAVPVSVWAVLAGDAFSVIADAVYNGKTTSADIASYLTNTLKDYVALTGPISFDKKGDRIGDFYRTYVVDANGKFILQAR